MQRSHTEFYCFNILSNRKVYSLIIKMSIEKFDKMAVKYVYENNHSKVIITVEI